MEIVIKIGQFVNKNIMIIKKNKFNVSVLNRKINQLLLKIIGI